MISGVKAPPCLVACIHHGPFPFAGREQGAAVWPERLQTAASCSCKKPELFRYIKITLENVAGASGGL